MAEPLKPRGHVDGRRVLVRGAAPGTALKGDGERVFVLLNHGGSGNFPAADVKPLEAP